jgi:hypothetical protein
VGLRGLLGRVERAGGSIAAGAARGRGRAAEAAGGLRRSAPFRHGLAAAERGNLDAALPLLREAVELTPEDGEAVVALWNVALSCERPELASEAMAGWIHAETASGRRDLAAEHWIELSERVPEQGVDVPTLVRLVPELRRRVAESQDAGTRSENETWLRRALRACVAPEAPGMTTGLALRILDQARFIDAEAARAAAAIVLSASDLHEARRERVHALIAELDRGEAARPAPSEASAAEDEVAEEAERQAPEPPARRVFDAAPVELSERGLTVLEIESGQRTRVDLRQVEVLAVVRVEGLGDDPVQLIDLVLRRTPRQPSRRIVRLRADRFDADQVLADVAPADDPLRALLGALLDRSGAVPLPDPDSALGLEPRLFPSLEDYEAGVLDRLDAA